MYASSLCYCSHLLLQFLDVSCNVDQLFGGQRGRTPTLTATFIHWSSAGGRGSWAGQRPGRLFGHLSGRSFSQHLCNINQVEVNRHMAVHSHCALLELALLKIHLLVYFALPHQETWHIARRAAESVSRGDEPEVAGRLCLTNISLNRTTAPQIPAGGRCCQLDMNRHIQLLHIKCKLYTSTHDRGIYLYLVLLLVHHLWCFLDFLLFPCTWKTSIDTQRAEGQNNQYVISLFLAAALIPTCWWCESRTVCIEKLGHKPSQSVSKRVCIRFGGLGRGSGDNVRQWLHFFHIDQWSSSQGPVSCVWAMFSDMFP